MNNRGFFFDILYPYQNRILQIIRHLETEFYLSGGTAASRGYLNHRFSDDLDLFVNDDERFTLWVERIIQGLLQQPDLQCQVLLKETRFARINISQGNLLLKIEMINDVPARVGEIRDDPILGFLDSPENILANKITALMDREEPKDLADIWGFSCQMGLSLEESITHAQSKAAGVFPADLGRLLCSVSEEDWRLIRWIQPPNVELFITQLYSLGEQLLLGK